MQSIFVGASDLESSELQELGDIMHKPLELEAKTEAPIRFPLRIALGEAKDLPSTDSAKQFNSVLENNSAELEVRR